MNEFTPGRGSRVAGQHSRLQLISGEDFCSVFLPHLDA